MTDTNSHRGLQLLAATIVAVSALGFVVGTRPAEVPSLPPLAAHPDPNVQSPNVPAPTYTQLRAGTFGANGAWLSDIASLTARLPSPLEPISVTEEERETAYRSRLDNRAYDGAPPTIPHPINNIGVPECAACHVTGMRVDDRVAQPMSHDFLTSCTQCHVPTGQTFGGRPSEGALVHVQSVGGENLFGGHMWPRQGTRAWIGAPPTVPHPTWMRQNCDSCHGVAGRYGLRTPHPERQSCEQCHAPSALLDQRPTTAFVFGTP